MDVRCEKCFTVYDLDDAKVGDAGLTVKCQECGNLFKVRRRPDTAELVAARPVSDDEAEGGAPPTQAAQHVSSPDAVAGEEPLTEHTNAASSRARASRPTAGLGAEERGWLLRSARSGEVARFRELTTLQQWIVERKVTREDEISRGGESWKSLGGIAELASFFHIVEQAEAVARTSHPGLAVLRGNAPGGLDPRRLGAMETELLPGRREPSGPSTMGSGAFLTDVEDSRRELGSPASLGVDEDDVDPRPSRRGSRGLLIGLGLLALAAGVGAYVVVWRGDPTHVAGASAEVVAEIALRGRAALRLDTDEGFRQAISALDRAVSLDSSALLARIDLAEAHITWAAYLGEDAHHLEESGESAKAGIVALRADAHAHLERARRLLEEPTGTDAAASPALARAFADLLRVEGAPAPAVERYLQRAAQKSANDAEIAYVEGELALREGKTADALTRLGDAARLADESGAGMARARFRLALLAKASDRRSDAARECAALLRISPTHERGQALCAVAVPDLAPAAGLLDAGADLSTLPTTTTPRPADKLGEASLAPPGAKESLPVDYKQLVREADRLSEHGRSTQARKLYERALELDPKGLAALTGLGYCDLDSERYMQAVDRFNAALAVEPSAGDALIGLAESYKVRGQGARAIEFYKRYLASHPDGPKAPLAQKNLRDLETRASREPHAEATSNDKMIIKPKDKGADHGEVVLPKPPPEEEPPP